MVEIEAQTLNTLIEQAKSAAARAYAPYSHFPVGAALLSGSGAIYTGSNVENASYGLTICAERNAVFHLAAQGERQIQAVVIYTPTARPAAPCGACRQVINEFGPSALIVSVCDGAGVLRQPLSQLLPESFGPANLA